MAGRLAWLGAASMWKDAGARYGNKMPGTRASKREQPLQSQEVIGQPAYARLRLDLLRMVVSHPVCRAHDHPLDRTTFDRSPAQLSRPPLENHGAPAVGPTHSGRGTTAAHRLFGPNRSSANRKHRGQRLGRMSSAKSVVSAIAVTHRSKIAAASWQLSERFIAPRNTVKALVNRSIASNTCKACSRLLSRAVSIFAIRGLLGGTGRSHAIARSISSSISAFATLAAKSADCRDAMNARSAISTRRMASCNA